jgi:hypothetical protein
MGFGGFGFKPPFFWTDSAGLLGFWFRTAFVLAGEGVAVALLNARLAVGAEADFGDAVAAAGRGLGGVELLRAEGLACGFLWSAKRLRFARAELAGCAAFRVEGFAPGRGVVRPCVWAKRPSPGRRARGGWAI